VSETRKKWERLKQDIPWPRTPDGLKVTITIDASMQQIAALGPERARAFMEGIGLIVSAQRLYQ
jgi:hypothetical protein